MEDSHSDTSEGDGKLIQHHGTVGVPRGYKPQRTLSVSRSQWVESPQLHIIGIKRKPCEVSQIPNGTSLNSDIIQNSKIGDDKFGNIYDFNKRNC